jgi:hypothetical protein
VGPLSVGYDEGRDQSRTRDYVFTDWRRGRRERDKVE